MNRVGSLFLVSLVLLLVACSHAPIPPRTNSVPTSTFVPTATHVPTSTVVPTPTSTPTPSLESRLEGEWRELSAGSKMILVFFEGGDLEVSYEDSAYLDGLVCEGSYEIDDHELLLEMVCPIQYIDPIETGLRGAYSLEEDKLVLTDITSWADDEEFSEERLVFQRQD